MKTKAYLPKNPSSNVYRLTHTNADLPDSDIRGDLIVSMKGGTYVYLGVEIEHMAEMLAADSAGKYLNSVIKGAYEYRLATDQEATALATAEPVPWTDAEHASLFPNSDEARDQKLVETIDAAQAPAYNHPGGNLIVPPHNNWGAIPIDLKLIDREVRVQYAKNGDAAFDLMASRAADAVTNEPLAFPVTVMPGQHILVGTGIAMKLPAILAGFVLPRSGNAKKHRVAVVNAPGLIDSGYTGEIGVLYENRGDEPQVINQYDRVAQFMIVPVIVPTFCVVEELVQTERGSGGFGSTGVAAEGKVVV